MGISLILIALGTGLFETDHIENDLNHVDVAICEFYGIPNPQIQTQDQSA
jgi:hypothetical protein